MTTDFTIRVKDIEVFADSLDVKHAAAIFKEHGALVVRKLMKPYIAELHQNRLLSSIRRRKS